MNSFESLAVDFDLFVSQLNTSLSSKLQNTIGKSNVWDDQNFVVSDFINLRFVNI